MFPPPLTQRSAVVDACSVKHTTSHSVASTDILELTELDSSICFHRRSCFVMWSSSFRCILSSCTSCSVRAQKQAAVVSELHMMLASISSSVVCFPDEASCPLSSGNKAWNRSLSESKGCEACSSEKTAPFFPRFRVCQPFLHTAQTSVWMKVALRCCKNPPK